MATSKRPPAPAVPDSGDAHPGALTAEIASYRHTTPSGCVVDCAVSSLNYRAGIDAVLDRLDRAPGMYLSSNVEDATRYSRWDIGFAAPPLEITGRGRDLTFRALNERGCVLIDLLAPVVAAAAPIRTRSERLLVARVPTSDALFAEEERSLAPSLFSPLRAILGEFAGLPDRFAGLYGAFGYDLLLNQFETIALARARPDDQKDLHLYLPDELFVVDRRKEGAFRLSYTFSGRAADGAARSTRTAGAAAFAPPLADAPASPGALAIEPDLSDADYAALVDAARPHMARGDVFEMVLSRQFSAECRLPPSALYRQLRAANPSPYEFVLQMGDEALVGCSPEMFVRVQDRRVDICPIAGTARRTGNPVEDAERIRELLNSDKEKAELVMCTDVGRNDLSRVCESGSVRLLGHRMIERYAGLFHTVDHVTGTLRAGLSGLDAFMSCMYAVTLTGAPKRRAVELIEQMERQPRRWYGGAVGVLNLNGDINTGITIRTVRLKDGLAHYRAGASLVYDSVGAEEAQETLTKATGFFRALSALAHPGLAAGEEAPARPPARAPRVLLIDYEDSFVHILGDYFRQAGAEVATFRHGIGVEQIMARAPDLVVHSPGPGTPDEFGMPAMILALAERGVPQFGVCLGLQGMVRAFGGRLGQLAEPRQGKRWEITHARQDVFAGLPSPCQVGAYHALYADEASLPDCLAVTARNAQGIIMGVAHRALPMSAVQFHPESILSLGQDVGLRMIRNLLAGLRL